jgi:hypothetical protein
MSGGWMLVETEIPPPQPPLTHTNPHQHILAQLRFIETTNPHTNNFNLLHVNELGLVFSFNLTPIPTSQVKAVLWYHIHILSLLVTLCWTHSTTCTFTSNSDQWHTLCTILTPLWTSAFKCHTTTIVEAQHFLSAAHHTLINITSNNYCILKKTIITRHLKLWT